MKEHDIISDSLIAKKLMRPLPVIKEKMFNLSKNQKRKKWLIVFLNTSYIFYNEGVIQKFQELYDNGLGEKEILENLKKNINVRTRAEIKAIEKTLINHKRINERKDSLKKYREVHKFME